MISLDRYRELFQVRDVRAVLAASIVGRVPIGIAGLAILLFVQGRSSSFTLAGSASALYVLGLAAIAPLLGRAMDRTGPRPVLVACALLYPAALIGLAVLVLSSASGVWIGGMALLAGASLPPISACIRALYPRLIAEPALLQTAYSVDSALVEIVFVLGPALVAACVAAGHPEAAVLLAAASAGVGTVIFERSPSVRRWSAARRPQHRDALRVLRYPRLLLVFAATILYSIGFGLFEVGVTAHATARGNSAAAGIALACASLGSAAGALVYGSSHWRMPLPRQFLIALAFMAAGMLLLVPIDNLALYCVVSIASGMPMATVIASQSLLVARLSPRERLAESFTWSATCLLGGISGGIAAGGAMAEAFAPHLLLIAASGATAVAAVLTATFLKTAGEVRTS